MKIDVYDKTGKKMATKADLQDAVWNVPVNEDLVAQVLYVYSHNQRKGTAHSKSRSDVQGGGRKPWRQKGTGRARHGSIRSPLWVGGGVAFGPKSYKRLKRIPTKMQRSGLRSVLSAHTADGTVRVVKDLAAVTEGKTKDMVKHLSKLKIDGKKTLIIASGDDVAVVRRGSRNVDGVNVSSAADVNVYDVVDSEIVVVMREAIEPLEQRLTS